MKRHLFFKLGYLLRITVKTNPSSYKNSFKELTSPRRSEMLPLWRGMNHDWIVHYNFEEIYILIEKLRKKNISLIE